MRRLLAVCCLATLAGCGRHNEGAPPPAARGPRALRDVTYERTPSRRERGRYLTEGVLQCFACHSDRDWTKSGGPPIPSRKGAGHAFEGRTWLVAPNITPDPETGAGTWTDDMFARAIREGIGHDGRVLHPQMWYGAFRNLSDEDLASVIVYLRSLPAVRNPLPVTKLPQGRAPLRAPDPLAGPVGEPDRSTPVGRGRYLVRIADCLPCHTALESPLSPGFFGGGNQITLFGQPPVFSSNLTRAPSGIGGYYDAAMFRDVLRTGHLRGRSLSGVMPWIVFGNMTDDDLASVFAYLQSRRPVDHNVSNTDPPTPCPACGQSHGLGDRNRSKIHGTAAADPRAFAECRGRYRFEDGFVMAISTDGSRLQVQFNGAGPVFTLAAISSTEFTAPEIPDVISFRRDAHGRVNELVTNMDDVGVRIR
jgi:mono/diheme cytochrome c family protein